MAADRESLEDSRGSTPDEREAWPPQRKGDNLPGAGTLAMGLGILSFSMPFAGCVILLVAIRFSHSVWPPPNAPPLPPILALSTILLLLTSVFMEWAVSGARNERQGPLRAGMVVTLVLGGMFLACQLVAFLQAIEGYQHAQTGETRTGIQDNPLLQYIGFICLFTGYHALHLIGGLIFQGYVTARAFQGAYRYYYYAGARYMAMYWHFLGACWLLLYLALLSVSRGAHH